MPHLSYAQTHALALAGAGVLHPDAVTPLVALGVPTSPSPSPYP